MSIPSPWPHCRPPGGRQCPRTAAWNLEGGGPPGRWPRRLQPGRGSLHRHPASGRAFGPWTKAWDWATTP